MSQKLIVPPQVKKIPCHFLCRESLLFFSYFFLLSLFVLSLGAFASLKACNLKVPRYGTYCIHILVWSLPTLILSLVPLLALANGTPASMMKAEAWWVNAFVSCFFLPSCSDIRKSKPSSGERSDEETNTWRERQTTWTGEWGLLGPSYSAQSPMPGWSLSRRTCALNSWSSEPQANENGCRLKPLSFGELHLNK